MTTSDTPRIRREGPLPFYAQLADLLREKIADGTYQPGDSLPSEAELGTSYGLSRTAIRQALSLLVAEGLVLKEKGRGTFVRTSPLADFVVQEIRGFHEEMTDKSHEVTTKLLAREPVVAEAKVASELDIKTRSKVLRLFRVRLVDGLPLCETETFLPLPRFEDLSERDLIEGSLYSSLRSKFGIKPSGGHRFIESASAGKETAINLEVPIGAPLLKLTAVNLDQTGIPFEYFSALYRGDSTRFELSVKPNSKKGKR
jgi:GntR family transcriptional regulator